MKKFVLITPALNDLLARWVVAPDEQSMGPRKTEFGVDVVALRVLGDHGSVSRNPVGWHRRGDEVIIVSRTLRPARKEGDGDFGDITNLCREVGK